MHALQEEPMIMCDLCGERTDCLQKEIEGKEYDICARCWNALAQKLKGKGGRNFAKPCFSLR